MLWHGGIIWLCVDCLAAYWAQGWVRDFWKCLPWDSRCWMRMDKVCTACMFCFLWTKEPSPRRSRIAKSARSFQVQTNMTCLENPASWICISRTKRESQWVSCFIAWNNGRSKVLKALNASCSGYLFFLRAHRQLTKLRILSNESLHGTADTVDKCSFGSSLRQWASRACPSSTRWVFKLRGETGLSEGRGFKVVKCRQVVWIHSFPCRSACWLDGVPLAKGETRTASMARNKSIWRLLQVCHAALRVPHFKS